MNLPQAIARQEGFYIAGSRSARNHNPGNMNYGQFATKHGATGPEQNKDGSSGRFAFFPDDATGFAALTTLLKVPGEFEPIEGGRKLVSGYAGSTVHECLNRFAPPADDNNTSAYEANVCTWCGCTPDTIIDTLLEDA